MGLFDWLKEGAPLPKVTEFVESKPILAETLAYKPESALGYTVGGLGAASIAGAGILQTVKTAWYGISKAVPKIAKLLIPKTLKGAIIGTTAALLGGGYLLESPTAREFAVETVTDLPKAMEKTFELGQELGRVMEGEAELPEVSEGLKAAGLLGAGAVLATGLIVGGEEIIEKVKEFEPEKQIGIAKESPILPETVDIAKKRKPYKRRRATKTPSIRQSVRINIINDLVGQKITNKRYLNVVAYP